MGQGGNASLLKRYLNATGFMCSTETAKSGPYVTGISKILLLHNRSNTLSMPISIPVNLEVISAAIAAPEALSRSREVECVDSQI